MYKRVAGMLIAGCIFVSTPSFSDDAHTDTVSRSQMMKDCMARMTAKNDGSTKHEMKTACRNEMAGSMSEGNTTKGESLVEGANTPPK